MCLPNILSTVFMSSFSPCWLLLAGRWHFPLSHHRFELSCFSSYKIRLFCFQSLALVACVQTSPISFVARGKVPFPRATKEIGDVCTQAIALALSLLST